MINKSILLSTLSLGAMCSNTGLAAIANNQTTTNIVQDKKEKEQEACTVMYVGKDVAEGGMALVSRSADAGPRGMNLNFKIVEHNELANKTVKSLLGFQWRMPSTTYRYISTPKNVNVHSGLHWEVSGVNEMGVNVTATLTTYAEQASKLDPYVKTGIGEDNLTQVVAATASSARDGINIVASIIDGHGAQDSNTILIQDKNEVWLMEIYTGHHYVAIKMPDDVACTIGNECMLNSIGELKQKYGLKEGDYIVSPKILDFPNAKFTDGIKDIDHLELFNTFADPLDDSCHMRTWRGFNKFATKQFGEHPEYNKYAEDISSSTRTKYEPFFKPDRVLGVNDVISFMRDRFDNILADDQDDNHDAFTELAADNNLRWVAVDYAYQVHVMRVNPNLPTEYSCEEWMCLSNSNHAPFFPISNGINRMNDYYTHETEYYGYDDKSASCIFKSLNTLADTDRPNFGLPIQDLLVEEETIWQHQYADLINKIKDLSVAKARDYITNYCLYIQDVALTTSKQLNDQLVWHIANWNKKPGSKLFKPLVDIEYYANAYGWDYHKADKLAVLTHGNEKVEIDLDYLVGKQGSITKDGVTESVKISIVDDVPYMDYEIANKYLAKDKDIAPINLDDFESKNDLAWIIPVAVCVPILVAASIIIPIVVYNNKKKTAGLKNKKA